MKHLLSIALAALMLLSLLLPCVMAEGELPKSEETVANENLVITGVSQDPSSRELHIEFESALLNAEKAENYSVTLGGNKLEIKAVNLVEGEKAKTEADIPVIQQQDNRTSWIFLTDVSSIATNHGQEAVRSTLKSLAAQVGYFDNGAFVTTSNPNPVGLSNGQILESQTTAEYNQNATNLYSAVANALDYLTSNQATLYPNKCLVILSKGDDKTVTDAPVQSTVLQKIAASDVSVFTIAFSASPSYNFTAMARESQKAGHGGASIDYNNTSSDIAANVGWLIRNARSTGTGAAGEEKVERVKYTMDTSAPAEKGTDDALHMTFTNGDFETTAEFTPETAINYPVKSFFTRFIEGLKSGDLASVAIVAAAVVLIALIVVLLIRLLGGKKDKAVNYNRGEVVPPPAAAVSSAVSTAAVSGVTMPLNDTAATMAEPAAAKRLQLVLRESSGKVHRAMMSPTGVTAGRQGDNHIVLDSNDKHISRHHFVLQQQGESVVLEGISETNGTYVNGMRISGKIALRQRDVIRVGNTELTVTWKYE